MKMYRLICVLLGLLLSDTPLLADTEGHPVTLWRVAGQSNTIYLLGSIHLLRPEDHPLPSVIDEVYREAEILVMELDMDDLDSAATQQLFHLTGVLRDDRTLRDLMEEGAYAQAELAAKKRAVAGSRHRRDDGALSIGLQSALRHRNLYDQESRRG